MTHRTFTAPFAAATALALTAAPALAQTPPASVAAVSGIAVANIEAIVANSNAFRTAQTQRPVTYKPQIDQAEARRNQIQAQLQPLVDKFNKDRAANAPQATLAQEAQTIQGIQQSGQAELQRIVQPAAYSEAYVTEQIEGKLDQAVKAAMVKAKVSLLLNPQAIVASNNGAYSLDQQILTELNALIPSATLQPPAGWEPREVREQRAQQQAQAGGAPATPATRAGPQNTGR